jgi:hypothetical protein
MTEWKRLETFIHWQYKMEMMIEKDVYKMDLFYLVILQCCQCQDYIASMTGWLMHVEQMVKWQ